MVKRTFYNRLNTIRFLNTNRKDFVNKDLYKLLIKEDSIVVGYEMIKSNKGATTPAEGNKSLDAFGLNRLRTLKRELQDESWSPQLARRIYIPKPGKKEKRPLGIQGPEEKVVQSIVKIILDAIYEPIFSTLSFGFRPKRGAHDALKYIETKYDEMTYAIEGDIKGMYDNVNHHTLIKLLEKRIDDKRFINLIWKFLKAGYIDEGKFEITDIGTPQGSIVSPILANIYLHELDTFMENRATKVKKRNPKIRTEMYKKLDNEMRKIKSKLPKLSEDQRYLEVRTLRKIKMESLQVKMYNDPSERIVYARYADDFIIGIAGPKKLAEEIKDEVKVFLESLSLTLGLEKTKITDIRKDLAYFLGHKIGIDTKIKYSKVPPYKQKPYLKRTTGKLVYITAPIENMISKLKDKSFCDKKGEPTPHKLWSTQEDHEIVNLYNITFRGIFGFYSGVKKRNQLSRIRYIMIYSCALTLSYKHRRSLKKTFIKHGKSLTVSYGKNGNKVISLYQPLLKETDKTWQTGRKLPDPYRYVALRLSNTQLYDNCWICNSSYNIEMHHVRHLKDMKPGFDKGIMGALKREQIPVCSFCQDLIHKGMYDGISLNKLFNNRTREVKEIK